MIGVIANPSEHDVVREFFELFKSPWEFYRPDHPYEILLYTCNDKVDEKDAHLILRYSSQRSASDVEDGVRVVSQRNAGHILSRNNMTIPIYGESLVFQGQDNGVASVGRSCVHVQDLQGKILVRVGYDLFHEIRILLTTGQPIENAGYPTLELHIALLRSLIVENRIPLVEIPPVPHGYRFIACLTHDVDHPFIRHHKFDHTMFGFLYRSVIGSLIDLFRRRRPWRDVFTNWAAAAKLPFVYLGLADDYWSTFDRYVDLEQGPPSSFFVIPFKSHSGSTQNGQAPRRRASGYGATDLAGKVRKLISSGCEIGLHGIDAWLDSSKGQQELEQIRQITGAQAIGVRMHWLYFGRQSPPTLEQGGADYDSTVGYNETVGYRAGTAQAYKPLNATRLLELPLHIMDTALFFPGHLNLTPEEASKRVDDILDYAGRYGGSIVINWHDRSIAPERLWNDFYLHLIAELKSRGAWFATASQAVSWFRKRRSTVFHDLKWQAGPPKTAIAGNADDLPGLEVRVHNSQTAGGGTSTVETYAACR